MVPAHGFSMYQPSSHLASQYAPAVVSGHPFALRETGVPTPWKCAALLPRVAGHGGGGGGGGAALRGLQCSCNSSSIVAVSHRSAPRILAHRLAARADNCSRCHACAQRLRACGARPLSQRLEGRQGRRHRHSTVCPLHPPQLLEGRQSRHSTVRRSTPLSFSKRQQCVLQQYRRSSRGEAAEVRHWSMLPLQP